LELGCEFLKANPQSAAGHEARFDTFTAGDGRRCLAGQPPLSWLCPVQPPLHRASVASARPSGEGWLANQALPSGCSASSANT